MSNDIEFMSALLFDAYMADAITDGEVRRACAILSITYPPAKPDPDDSDMQQIHQANSEAVYVPLVFTGDHQRSELLAEQKRAAAYQDEALIFAESEFMKSQAAYGPKTEAANTSAATAPATGPMLKLGEINARLAHISITVDGLAQLGFTPAATDKASRLYRAADLPLILAAMVRHINGVGVDLLQAV